MVDRITPDAPSGTTAATRRTVRYPASRPGWSWERCKAALAAQSHASADTVEATEAIATGVGEAVEARGEIAHRPIMLEEVLRSLQPAPGHVAVDCTLGGGSHAQAILACVQPHGRLIGVDVDAIELMRTTARLRGAGFGSEVLSVHAANFAALPEVLAKERAPRVDVILVDLGVSSMQMDDPARGFHYKRPGPLDMRMDTSRGESASDLLARATEDELAALLVAHADEPHAALIAGLIRRQPIRTTHALERFVRVGLSAALPHLTKTEVKLSVRRTFQALRIAVNGELDALDTLLRVLPDCLAPGGRVAILTFHSGEDRRVKQAFRAGLRAGVYDDVADPVIRSGREETFADRRAGAAKLRWAIRASV
jgi:16S rRNA (cytosine1402-N4)-methyltransferase